MVSKKALTWIEENTDKHICGCGCGKYIVVTESHYYYGIPKYIHGHNTKSEEFRLIQSEKTKKEWEDGKHSRTQSEEHLRRRLESLGETRRLQPGRWRGEHAPMYNKRHTDVSKDKISKSKIGKCGGSDHPNWQGGLSFGIYPIEFSELLKTTIRNKYNNCDYISGIHKDICSPNRKLDIHHIDYNKQNNDEDNLIPLFVSNHSKTQKNRIFWEKLFKYSLEIDKTYYDDLEINIWRCLKQCHH